jgi:putative tricarboxylic transport membrane protein
MKKTIVLILGLALAFALVAPVVAAPYPSKPLEIVVSNNPGSGWDQLGRAINVSLEKEKLYPQPMSVVNKPGGGGTVGFLYALSQEKNDYELIPFSPPILIKTIDTTLQGSYKDLTPLAMLTTDFECVAVKADSPFKTLKDLIDAMKKDAGAYKVAGGSSVGSMDHLSFLKIAQAAGIDPSKVIYVATSGGGEAMTMLLGGNNVAFASTDTGSVKAQLEAGTVRVLAISAAARRPGVFANVPTVKESGYNVTFDVWRGVFGVPGMSKEAQAWWAATLKKMVTTETWKGQLANYGWAEGYMAQADFAKFLDADYALFVDLMKKVGLTK